MVVRMSTVGGASSESDTGKGTASEASGPPSELLPTSPPKDGPAGEGIHRFWLGGDGPGPQRQEGGTNRCRCGCGEEIPDLNAAGKPRKFATGHHGKSRWRPRAVISCACGCGELLTVPDDRGRERRYLFGHYRPRNSIGRLRPVYTKGYTPWNKGRTYTHGGVREYATRGSWREAIERTYGRNCMMCPEIGIGDAHHIIPMSKGGKHSLENAVVLCPNCHRKTHLGRISVDDLLATRKRAAILSPRIGIKWEPGIPRRPRVEA